MTELKSEGKQKNLRYILGPHICPIQPQYISGATHYISWAGWELFLKKQLKVNFSPQLSPVLLPDIVDERKDYQLILDLAQRATELGASFIFLPEQQPENLDFLSAAIRSYHDMGNDREAAKQPLLDDRSYLALWTLNQLRLQQSRELLAEASALEKQMWAALKGETEPGLAANSSNEPVGLNLDDGQRGTYAWKCWRRISKCVLHDDDVIIAAIPESQA